MLSRVSGVLFFTTFALVIVLLAELSQNNQCFKSQIINRITFIDGTFVESCGQNSDTPFSREFELRKQEIQTEITQLEEWISLFWRVEKKNLKLRFVDEPLAAQFRNGELLIWNKKTSHSWALQKVIIENSLPGSIEDLKLREFLADFYVRIWNKNAQQGYGNLNSYISYRWWKAFERLSIKNKINLLKQLPNHFVQTSRGSRNHYEHVIQLSEIPQKTEAFKAFSGELNNLGGLVSYNLHAEFDFLLMVNDLNSRALNQMDQLQKRFPDKSLGIWNGEVLYHVPSKSYLSAKSFEKIKSHHYVWEICGDIGMRKIFEIPADVKKVLLIRNCQKSVVSVYASYLSGHIENFAASQSTVPFVLFDIPSLRSQKDLIGAELNVFEILNQRAHFPDLFAKLGWQNIVFNQDLKVFVPQSVVDSIQYFRGDN